MPNRFERIALKLHPELDQLSGQRRLAGVADVLTMLYMLPLFLLALTWLVLQSEWAPVKEHWTLFLLSLVLMFLFNRWSYFLITEIRSGGYANTTGALDGIVLWTALLIMGPTALWLDVLSNLVSFLRDLPKMRVAEAAWSRGRIFVSTVVTNVISAMLGLMVYRGLGGVIPYPGLFVESLLPPFAGILISFLVSLLVYSGYIGYVVWSIKHELQGHIRQALYFFFMAFALPALANPFAILAAGLYVQHGIALYLYDMLGLLLVALLARRLSQAAESTRQQSRQLDELEKLGRGILNGPPDASTLPDILAAHVPPMFSSTGICIWTEGRGILLNYPAEWRFDQEKLMNWLSITGELKAFLPAKVLPWESVRRERGPVIVAPIRDVENERLIGAIYLELQSLVSVAWNPGTVNALLPAVQTLSAQVASAVYQAHVYHESLALQKTMQELEMARTIQDSFMPAAIPQVSGWQIAATLEPARQMAGDFYDFLTLPDGRLGVLIADVADKGLGPALYMALSSTLIRTFAAQPGSSPAQVMRSTNQRILRDARANLFVTVFYGVLDPQSGLLTYANAGHAPPILVSSNPGLQVLRNTGMPLGIDEENTWTQEVVQMQPKDVLLLYTDGVTDAQNSQGDFIDRRIVQNIARQYHGQPIPQIQAAILREVHGWIGNATRFDDITLVILGRD